jgi:hypothetical protein
VTVGLLDWTGLDWTDWTGLEFGMDGIQQLEAERIHRFRNTLRDQREVDGPPKIS